MIERDRFCHACGAAFPTPLVYPRVCGAASPPAGKLALVGGFVDEHERWQDAAAREVVEETAVVVDRASVALFDAVSTEPRPNRILLFATTAPVAAEALPPLHAERGEPRARRRVRPRRARRHLRVHAAHRGGAALVRGAWYHWCERSRGAMTRCGSSGAGSWWSWRS